MTYPSEYVSLVLRLMHKHILNANSSTDLVKSLLTSLFNILVTLLAPFFNKLGLGAKSTCLGLCKDRLG